MQPSFQGFFRVGHRLVLNRGGDVGGALMATTLADVAAAFGSRGEIAALTLHETAAMAIYILEKDPAVTPVPFAVSDSCGPAHADGAAIMVECYDTGRLDGIAQVLDAALDRRRLAAGRAPWTRYEFAYLLDREGLEDIVSLEEPGGDV